MAFGCPAGSFQRISQQVGVADVPKNIDGLPGVNGVFRAAGVLAAIA